MKSLGNSKRQPDCHWAHPTFSPKAVPHTISRRRKSTSCHSVIWLRRISHAVFHMGMLLRRRRADRVRVMDICLKQNRSAYLFHVLICIFIHIQDIHPYPSYLAHRSSWIKSLDLSAGITTNNDILCSLLLIALHSTPSSFLLESGRKHDNVHVQTQTQTQTQTRDESIPGLSNKPSLPPNSSAM